MMQLVDHYCGSHCKHNSDSGGSGYGDGPCYGGGYTHIFNYNYRNNCFYVVHGYSKIHVHGDGKIHGYGNGSGSGRGISTPCLIG